MKQPVHIQSRKYWIKVLAMLQQNWAIIETPPETEGGPCDIFFIDDNSCVFDSLRFLSPAEAEDGLKRNGFRRYESDANMLRYIPPPSAPFYSSPDCHTGVYSSGEYWK